MRMSRTAWLAVLTASALVGCDPTFFLLPVEPEDVTVEVDVTGGLAGASYAFVLDGGAGEVRGTRCAALCSFQAGEVLAAVSSDQVAQVARFLDDSGIVETGEHDYGEGCCDFLYVDLNYHREGEVVRIRGTMDRFPEALSRAVALLAALGDGRVPVIVSPDTQDTDWPLDAYTLGEVSVDGLTLSAEVTYGGGCAGHRMDLVLWGAWMESAPVRVRALVTHDDADDPCDALVTETRRFDLWPLVWAYEKAYGRVGGARPSVILQLYDPLAANPLGRLIEVPL